VETTGGISEERKRESERVFRRMYSKRQRGFQVEGTLNPFSAEFKDQEELLGRVVFQT